MLVAAIILITLALVAYTTGVLAERRSGTLHWWHAGAFAVGFVFDASGTAIMSLIARSGAESATAAGGLLSAIMAATGALTLLLMFVHLVWAVVVLLRRRERELRVFHRLSLGVWALWLVPYITGMASAMAG